MPRHAKDVMRFEGFLRSEVAVIRLLLKQRDLVLSMVRRQFQIRYRQSLIGLAWALVPPIVTVAAATLVFHEVAHVDTGDVPYPIFAFSALVPWTFLVSSMTGGVMSVVSMQTVLTRIPFLRAALPISMVGLAFVDLAVSAATFVVFSTISGNPLPVTALLFPIPLLVEIVFVTGVVLLLSALNVFARDIKLMLPFFIQLWLFLTPVMYPLASVPSRLRPLYLLNPMTGVVEQFRRIVVSPGTGLEVELMAPAILGALVAFLVGRWYFSATEMRFADVV
jgi:lipopolysaccharide transport system permease protein